MELENSVNPERRFDLDWLRIFAIMMIFFFHCARAYDYLPWEIKNDELDIGLTVFMVFTAGWIMPLFFVLSGMSIFYALGVRENGEFVKERTKRLIVPYLFGICTILSIHVYIEVLYGSEYLPPFSGNFFEFYFFRYFTSGFWWYGGYFPLKYGIYLWYLFFLFIYSLICLYLFRYLRKEKNQEKISKLAKFSCKPGALFLFVIPLILMMFVAYLANLALPFIFGEQGGWNILLYFVFFIYGYLFASNKSFREATEKHRVPALIIGIITSIIIMVFFLTNLINVIRIPGVPQLDYTTFGILYLIFWPLNGFCWLIAILGFGSKYLNSDHKSRKFLNELVLPFYVIHQTVIIVIAFYLIDIDLIVILKYFIVASVSFVIIIGLVLIIRKINVLRFLFGMRLKKKENT